MAEVAASGSPDVTGGGFGSFLARRTAASIVTLVLFVTVVFFLVELLIPYESPLLEESTPAIDRYLSYMGGLLRGDLGMSYIGVPVADIILDALPTTLLIFATGGILAYLLGSWLVRVGEWGWGRFGGGLLTAAGLLFYTMFPPLLIFLLIHFGRKPLLAARSAIGIPVDSLQVFAGLPYTEAEVVTFGGVSMLAALLVALILRGFGRRRGWRLLPALVLPATLSALVLAISKLGIGQQALDVFFFRSSRAVEIGSGSPVLAVLGFALIAFGEILFVWRAGIADERGEDYVLTARAKAVPEPEIRDRHVARNVVLPVLSRSFSALPFLLTGLVLVEFQTQLGSCVLDDAGNVPSGTSAFGTCVLWSGGLSTALFSAVRNVDVPVIMGILIAIGVLILVLRLVAETAQMALDPRIRLEA
ncbi:MAG TPA: ABC transporter permease [Acidimicrobiia bacterium]|nr:ABC transporter permease [Acidimicrobiia bacterium]